MWKAELRIDNLYRSTHEHDYTTSGPFTQHDYDEIHDYANHDYSNFSQNALLAMIALTLPELPPTPVTMQYLSTPMTNTNRELTPELTPNRKLTHLCAKLMHFIVLLFNSSDSKTLTLEKVMTLENVINLYPSESKDTARKSLTKVLSILQNHASKPIEEKTQHIANAIQEVGTLLKLTPPQMPAPSISTSFDRPAPGSMTKWPDTKTKDWDRDF